MEVGQSSHSNAQRTDFITSPYKETQTKAVREYEETISQLRKENFDLKFQVFLCEQAHKETYHVKDGSSEEKEDCIQIIVNLKLETEELKKELNGREEEVQSVEEKYSAEIERYQTELLEAQKIINEQKEFIGILEQLPTAEDYNEVRRQYSAMVSDGEDMKQLLAEKDEEIQIANQNIEELQNKILALNQKVKKRNEAIRSCSLKYQRDVDYIPKQMRPIIKSLMEAARNNSEAELLSSLEDFKRSLSEIMGVPMPSNLQSSILNSSAASSSTSTENSIVEDLISNDALESYAVQPTLIEGDLDSADIVAHVRNDRRFVDRKVRNYCMRRLTFSKS